MPPLGQANWVRVLPLNDATGWQIPCAFATDLIKLPLSSVLVPDANTWYTSPLFKFTIKGVPGVIAAFCKAIPVGVVISTAVLSLSATT